MAAATATTPITTTIMQRPTPRQRRHTRELARVERAASLYERRDPPVGACDECRWYRAYLLDEYPAYIG